MTINTTHTWKYLALIALFLLLIYAAWFGDIVADWYDTILAY